MPNNNNNSMYNDADALLKDNSGMHPNITPVSKIDMGIGDYSTYDPNPDKYSKGFVPTGNPLSSQEGELSQFKANNQTTFQKIGNTLIKGILEIPTTAVEPLGTLVDLPMWFSSEERMNKGYENFFTKAINNTNEDINKSFPVYLHNENPTPITSADWWYQNGSSVISMLGFLGTAGALDKAAGMLLEGLGDAIDATKFGSAVGKTLSTLEDTSMFGDAASGLKTLSETGKLNQLGSSLLSSAALAHSTGMADAAQTFKIAKDRYTQYYSEKYPNFTPTKINDLAKHAAAKEAEKTLNRHLIDILFYSAGIGNMLKGVKASSTYATLMGDAMVKDVAQSTATLYAMGVTDKFISNEALRDIKINTGLEKDDGSTLVDRYLKEAVSKEGLSAGAVGALNALLLQGFTYMRTRGARQLALERMKENAKTIGDSDKFDKLSKQQFFDLVLDNAAKGTMKNVYETLESISNLKPEEVNKLGLSDNYMDKAKEYSDIAYKIEDEYNKYTAKYPNHQELANEIVINRYLDRDNRREINKVDLKLKELNNTANTDELNHPLHDVKYNSIQRQVNISLIDSYSSLLDRFKDKDNNYRDIETGLTKDEIQSKIDNLKLRNRFILAENERLKTNYLKSILSDNPTKEEIDAQKELIDNYLYTIEKDKNGKINKKLNLSDYDEKLAKLLLQKADLESSRDVASKKASLLDNSKEAQEQYIEEANKQSEIYSKLINNTKEEIAKNKTLTQLDEYEKNARETGSPNLDNPIVKNMIDAHRKVLENKAKTDAKKEKIINSIKKSKNKVTEVVDKLKNKEANTVDEKPIKQNEEDKLSNESNKQSASFSSIGMQDNSSKNTSKTPTKESINLQNKIEELKKNNSNIEKEYNIGDYKKVQKLANNFINGNQNNTSENQQLLNNYPNLFEELIKNTKDNISINDETVASIETNSIKTGIEDGDAGELNKSLANKSDNKISETLVQAHNAIHTQENNGYKISFTINDEINRIDDKIVEGANAAAYLSSDYISIVKIYKSDKRSNKIDRKSISNEFKDETAKIIANTIQKGDIVKFEIDADYIKEHNLDLNNMSDEDRLHNTPIIAKYKYNGKWIKTFYVHEPEWIAKYTDNGLLVPDNIAGIKIVDGTPIDITKEQYDSNIKIRKYILDKLNNGEEVTATISDKKNGHLIEHIAIDKNGNFILNANGVPRIEKGKVSELMPEHTELAIAVSDDVILGKGKSLGLKLNTNNIYPGTVFKVVSTNVINNLTGEREKDIIPLITPKITTHQQVGFNIENYLKIHFSDYDITKLNDDYKKFSNTTQNLFDRNNSNSLFKFLDNYLQLKKFNIDTLIRSPKGKYLFNVDKDGTFSFGSTTSEVLYSAKIEDGKYIFTSEIASGITKDLTLDEFMIKFNNALHDKQSFIPFAVKYTKINGQDISIHEPIIHAHNQIGIKNRTNDDFEITNVNTFKNYNRFVEDKLQTTFVGTNKDSDGNYIYFTQPNLHFNIAEEMKPENVEHINSDLDNILNNTSEEGVDLDNILNDEANNDGRPSINSVEADDKETTIYNNDDIKTTSDYYIKEFGSFTQQKQIANSLIKPILRLYTEQVLNNSSELSKLNHSEYFNQKYLQLVKIKDILSNIKSKFDIDKLSINDKDKKFLASLGIDYRLNNANELLSDMLKYYEITTKPDIYKKLVEHAKSELNNIGINTKGKEFNFEGFEENEDGENNLYETAKYDDKARLKLNDKHISSPLFKAFLYTIPYTESKDGKNIAKRNVLGLDMYANIDDIYNKLHSISMDKVLTFDDMMKVLRSQQTVYPVFKTIADRLNNDIMIPVQTEMVNYMAKYRHELQTAIESKFNKATLINNNSTTGKYGIFNDWRNKFNISNYIIAKDDNSFEYDIDKINELKSNYSKAYDLYKNDYLNPKFQNIFKNILSKFGIDLSNRTINTIFELPNSIEKANIEQILNPKASNSFIGMLFRLSNSKGDIDKISPFNNKAISKYLLNIAKVEDIFSDKVFDNSAIDGSGNLIFEPQDYNYLKNTVNDILNPNGNKLSDLLKASFSKHSLWLNAIASNSNIRKNFKVSFFDSYKLGNNSSNATERKLLTESNQNKIALDIFANSTHDRTNFFGLTFGENSTSPIFTTARQDIKLYFDEEGGKIRVDDNTVELAFNQALNEIERIKTFQDTIKKTKFSDYNNGAETFFLYRYLNKDELSKIISKDELGEIYTGNKLEITPNGINIIKDVIRRKLEEHIENTIADFEEHNNIKSKEIQIKDKNKDEVKTVKIYTPDNLSKQYSTDKTFKPVNISGKTEYYKNKTLLESDTLRNTIANFAIQSKLANAEMYYMLADPAIMTKVDKDGKVDIEATFKNLQKRLKGALSPHITGNWTTPTFRSVTAKDRIIDSKHLNEYHDKLKINGYKELETTDGFELTTLKEDIEFRLANNLIKPNIAKSILNKIKKVSNTEDRYFELDNIEKDAIFNVNKPILYSSKYYPDEDVNMIHFRKSSAMPLLPEMTRGLPLDKIRVAMERDGVDRVGFNTTDKLGKTELATLFDKEGNILNNIRFNDNQIQTINRDVFGMQQHIPTDNHEVAVITQLNSLALDGLLDTKGFKYKDKTYNGHQLRDKKEELKIKLFELGKQRVLNRFGIEESNGEYKFTNYSGLKKLLLNVAKKNNWSDIDIQQLGITKDGKSFKFPLIFNNSLDRIQSALVSYLNKEIIKIKFNGSGDVQVPDLGFGKAITTDYNKLSDSEKSNLKANTIFIDGYNNNTLDAYGINNDSSVRRMQVLVSWGFTDNTGNLLDINKFTKINDDGRLVIDTDKLPKEVLEGIYTRIPKQKHGSTVPFEIVGFLPENMKKTVVVADGITEQMGSDFDIDKMYSYLKYRYLDKDGKFNVVSKDTKDDIEHKLELINEYKTLQEQFGELVSNNKAYVEIDGKKKLTEIGRKIQDKIDEIKTEVNDNLDEQYYKQLLKINTEDNVIKNDYVDLLNSIYTHPDVAKIALTPLTNTDLDNEILRQKFSTYSDITDWKYQRDSYNLQQNGKDLIGIISLANIYNAHAQAHTLELGKILRDKIKILDDTGNVLDLNYLGGTAKSKFIDDNNNVIIRSKSDNIQTLQDAAVDNGANPKLGYLGVNVNNINSIITALRLKTNDNESMNINFILRLIKIPLVKEYLNNILEFKNNNDFEHRGFELKYANDKLEEKYKDDLYKDNDKLLSAKMLLDAINDDNITNSTATSALELFKKLYKLGDAEAKVMSTVMSAIRNGAGKNIYESMGLANRLYSDVINNEYIPKAYELLGDLKYDKNNRPYIDYKTELGKAFENSVIFTNQSLGRLLNINTPKLRTVFSELYNNNIPLNAKNIKGVVDEYRTAILSSKSGIVPNDIVRQERYRLLYGKTSLWNRIQDYLKTNDNKFLDELKIKSVPGKDIAKRIAYDNTKGKNISEVDNINYINEMLYSDNLELKSIGEDLVKYSYLVSPIFNTISFTRFISTKYLEELGVDKNLRNINITNVPMDGKTNVNTEAFIAQQYQHKPYLAINLNTDGIDIIKSHFGSKGFREEVAVNLDKKIFNGKVPNFLSDNYKDNNGSRTWLLYEYIGVNNNNEYVYKRIDTAGNANKQGKYIKEYNLNTRRIISLFNDNQHDYNYKGIEKIISRPTEINDETPTTNSLPNITAVDKYAKDGKLTSTLKEIKSNDYYSLIADTFSKYFKHTTDVNFAFDNSLPNNIAGIYKDGLIRMNGNIDLDNPKNIDTFEAKILHESAHAITDKLIDNYFNNKSANTKEVNAILDRLNEVFIHSRNKIISNSDKEEYLKDLINKFSKLNKNDKLSISKEDAKYYGFTDLHEFISETISNNKFRELLNNVKYNKDRTVLDKINGLLQKVYKTILKSFGLDVKPNTALDYTFNEIFNLMHENSKYDNFDDLKVDGNDFANKTVVEKANDNIVDKLNLDKKAILTKDELSIIARNTDTKENMLDKDPYSDTYIPTQDPTNNNIASNYKVFTKESIISGLRERGVIDNNGKILDKNTIYKLQQKLGDRVLSIKNNTLEINESELANYNTKLKEYAANNTGQVYSTHNSIITTEHSPEIKKMINEYNILISKYNYKLTGTMSNKERAIIETRIDKLREFRDELIENDSIDTIKTIANKQLDLAHSILNKKELTHLDIQAASDIASMWNKNTTDNYLTAEQKLNPENSEYKVYRELNTRAIDIDNEVLYHARELALDYINNTIGFNKEIKLKDLLAIHDIPYFKATFMDLFKAKSPLLQTIGMVLSIANNGPNGVILEMNKTVDDIFKPIENDKSIKSIVGNNFDIFHKKDSKGNILLSLVERTSAKWDEDLANFKNKLSLLDNQFDNGIIKDKNTYLKRRFAEIRKQNKKQILVDIVALGLTGRVNSRQRPGYKFDDPSEYKQYLVDELGKNIAEEVIENAKSEYQQYLNDKEYKTELINDSDLSKEEKDVELKKWIKDNNPELTLDRIFTGEDIDGGSNGFKYIVKIPRRRIKQGDKYIDTGYYDKDFEKIMANDKLREIYNKHNELLTKFLIKLPRLTTNNLDTNFLPGVLKSSYDTMFKSEDSRMNILNSKLIESIASTDVRKLVGDKIKLYVKSDIHGKILKSIPIHYVEHTQPDYMYSTDLKYNLKKFGEMALNYEYKNAMEPVLFTLLKVLDNAREIQTTDSGANIYNENGELQTKDNGLVMSHKLVDNSIAKIMYDEGLKHKYSSKVIHNPPSMNEVKLVTLRRKLERGEITKDEYDSKSAIISKSDDSQITLLNAKQQHILKRLGLQIENDYHKLENDFENNNISEEEYNTKLNRLEKDYEALGGRNLSTTKVADKFLYLTQMKGMALNFTSGMGNFLYGIIAMFTHANGRVEFNNKTAFKAMNEVLSTRLKSKEDNKVYNIMKNGNIVYDTIDARHDTVKSSDMFKQVHNLDFYVFQSQTEYLIQAMSYIAKMMHYKVEDKNGNTISLYDAYKNDGTIDIDKMGEDFANRWNHITKPGEVNDFVNFRESGIELNKMLHGNYDPSSPKLINSTLFGKALMQFRNWIPEGIFSRFSDEFYDRRLGRTIKGRWTTYGELGIGGSLKTLLKQILYRPDAFIIDGEKMKDVDIENMRRNLGELAVAVSILGMMLGLKAIINWNKDENNGGIGASSAMVAYNILFRANQDIYFYNNPKTFYNILRSPLPATKVFTDFMNAAHGSYKELTQDNYRGQSWYSKWAKVFPILNQAPKWDYYANNMLKTNYGYQ